MKVERQEAKPFQPIVITIETREEASTLYDVLNCGAGKPLAAYAPTVSLNTKHMMWKQFAQEYRRIDA